jgi:hypothetical protein
VAVTKVLSEEERAILSENLVHTTILYYLFAVDNRKIKIDQSRSNLQCLYTIPYFVFEQITAIIYL